MLAKGENLDDAGMIEPEPVPGIPAWVTDPPPPPEDTDEAPEDVPSDPPPAHVAPEARGGGGKAPRKTVRLNAATRKDIEAKIGIMIEVPGRIWQARDPWCGGAFVSQAPDIRVALAELVCQSPDLVAWFAGVGGGFMLWLNLIMALQPVGLTVWAHHVSHAIGQDGQVNGQGAPVADMAGYRA